MTRLHRQAPTMPFWAFQQSSRRGGWPRLPGYALRGSRSSPVRTKAGSVINGDGGAREVDDVLPEQGGPLRAHQQVGSSL